MISGYPSSVNKLVNQIACLKYSERDIYSASVVDVDTDLCFLLAHEIGPFLSINI